MNPKLLFPMAMAALVHIGLGQNQGESNTNTKFFTDDSNLNNLLIGGAAGVGATLLGQTLLGGLNQNNGCRRKRQAQSDTKFLGSLFPSNNNNCYNPCGRKKRQSDNNPNNKLFGLFGGNNNNNCGGGNSYNRCQCSNLSKTDNYGREEARCAQADHTGRRWCYSTSSSNCYDAQRSSRYPNNPWSYNACGNSG